MISISGAAAEVEEEGGGGGTAGGGGERALLVGVGRSFPASFVCMVSPLEACL